MKWTRGVARLVTTSCVAVLIAAGLGLAVRAQPGQASFTGSAPPPQTTAAAPTLPAPSATTQGPLAPAVTLTSRPTPTSPTSPSAAPAPVSTPRTTEPLPSRAPAALPTLDFALSSFNVLGSSHTSATGKKPGMASGPVRARWAAELIRRHGADVVGFQELQGNQLAALQRYTDMDFFPGFSMRRADTENSIGWHRGVWVAVETHTVDIPYFNGNRRAMPYVKLRHVATGIEAWFANFHNPADTRQFRRQQVYRSRATAIQIALVNRLLRRSDTPVFVTGDMNERGSYFCRLTGGAPMVAARGGSNNGVCRPDDPRAVDWIFGSRGVSFTDYVEDRGSLVDITTDHPMLVARAHLVGRPADTSGVPGDLPGAVSGD